MTGKHVVDAQTPGQRSGGRAEIIQKKPITKSGTSELAYDRWFRNKVMAGIADAEAGHFTNNAEIRKALRRWR